MSDTTYTDGEVARAAQILAERRAAEALPTPPPADDSDAFKALQAQAAEVELATERIRRMAQLARTLGESGQYPDLTPENLADLSDGDVVKVFRSIADAPATNQRGEPLATAEEAAQQGWTPEEGAMKLSDVKWEPNGSYRSENDPAGLNRPGRQS